MKEGGGDQPHSAEVSFSRELCGFENCVQQIRNMALADGSKNLFVKRKGRDFKL